MDKYIILKKLFEENQDENNAFEMSKYMRNKFLFYGLPTPLRRKAYKTILNQEKANKKIDWKFLDYCYNDEHREFQYFVIDYLFALKKYLSINDLPKIKRYIKTKPWWDTIDSFNKIVAYIALIDNKMSYVMIEWSTDEDFWIRRIAIIHQLYQKEKTNTKLLEEILVNNLGGTEFFINKAIGWSLREYSFTNPIWVKKFINKYKNKMAKLSIREASKYI